MASETTAGSDDESLLTWLQSNARSAGVGAVLVAVAAGSVWFYLRSADIRRQNAERGLIQARQSLAAGNTALATTDLQRVATRYQGTLGGAQAALLLAQLEYDRARHADGLRALEPYRSSSAARQALPDVWSLVGDGQIALGQADSAAASYEKAAESTNMPATRALLLAKAARALMAGGRPIQAQAIWERLLADPDAAIVKSEAELRLGELASRPAK